MISGGQLSCSRVWTSETCISVPSIQIDFADALLDGTSASKRILICETVPPETDAHASRGVIGVAAECLLACVAWPTREFATPFSQDL